MKYLVHSVKLLSALVPSSLESLHSESQFSSVSCSIPAQSPGSLLCCSPPVIRLLSALFACGCLARVGCMCSIQPGQCWAPSTLFCYLPLRPASYTSLSSPDNHILLSAEISGPDPFCVTCLGPVTCPGVTRSAAPAATAWILRFELRRRVILLHPRPALLMRR